MEPVSTTDGEGDLYFALTRHHDRARRLWLLLSTAEEGRPPLGQLPVSHSIQPFFQKLRTSTVAKEFQIGLCEVVEAEKNKIQIGLREVVEADLKLFCNYWSGESFGERLYVVHDGCTPTRKHDSRWLVGALSPLPSSRYASSAKRRAAQSSLPLRGSRDDPVGPQS